MTRRFLSALALWLGAAVPAHAADMLYDFQWTTTTELSRAVITASGFGSGSTTRSVSAGAGPLTLTTSATLSEMGFTFSDRATGDGGAALMQSGLFTQTTFTTGLERVAPPALDRYVGAGTYAPVGDPAAPTGFTLTLLLGFDCRTAPSSPACAGVTGWTSTLVGTATRASVEASEPAVLIAVGTGLLVVAALRRRRPKRTIRRVARAPAEPVVKKAA